jgi:hypothetical protein
MGLEGHTVLSRYFLSLFDVRTVADLSEWQALEDEPGEGGQTVFFKRVIEELAEELPALPDYDRHIYSYEETLRVRRKEFRSFKYFQYLALLFTEMYLDKLTRDAYGFLEELNGFLDMEQTLGTLDEKIEPLDLSDLRQLSFYLATGAGKTLLLHVHLWQIQHYLEHGPHPEVLVPAGHFENILLLAPNPGLAEQHLGELDKSGIPAVSLSDLKHSLSAASLLPGTVVVTDMFKLRDQRAKDPTQVEGIYYKDLTQHNLLFVDEGHKGTAREEGKWREVRRYLSERGTLFEYSATFAQVLKTETLKRTYAPRILFDYQYKYFYADGYGKEFQPLYVDSGEENGSSKRYEEAALMGALLLYYLQLHLYTRDQSKLEPFNLERPLWIFVGHTVTKKKRGEEQLSENTATLTDVAKVVSFLRRFLEEPDWARRLIDRVLHGPTLLGETNPFTGQLEELKDLGPGERLYERIANEVFGGRGAMELRAFSAPGEIGLRVSTSEGSNYFALVNVGDATAFSKLVKNDLGLEVRSDLLTRSLFGTIDSHNSPINLLVGSRKFIEGWSSWRVSAMTLLNLGRGEGPQVIQPLGRGVRLKGKDMSLRRAAVEPGALPSLGALQTLYVLGIRAEYVRDFLNTIREEEIPEKLEFPLERNLPVALPLPRLPQSFNIDAHFLSVKSHKDYSPRVQLAPKVLRRKVDELGVFTDEMEVQDSGTPVRLDNRHLALLDWPDLMRRLATYVRDKGYASALSLEEARLRKVLEDGHYTLTADHEHLAASPHGVQSAALEILRSYLDKFHRAEINQAQTERMRVDRLQKDELPRHYTVTVPKDHVLLGDLKRLTANLGKWSSEDSSTLPRFYLDPKLRIVGLAQPLVHDTSGTPLQKGLRVSPTPLNESESAFVRTLRQFWTMHSDEYPETTLYLLRNASRSGLGFHNRGGFYPDFVLWIERPSGWRVAFVEPHGMRNESVIDNPKIEIFTQVLPKLNSRTEFREARISLDGYILPPPTTPASHIPGVSEHYATDWEDLAREKHLLVEERGTERNVKAVLEGI